MLRRTNTTNRPICRKKQTFAALGSIVGPPTCAILTFHTPGRVCAGPLAVAPALVCQALVHI